MKSKIADALRDAMNAAGWSRTKVAYIAGVSQFAVDKWLSGVNVPRGDSLELLRAQLPGFAQRLDSAHAESAPLP